MAQSKDTDDTVVAEFPLGVSGRDDHVLDTRLYCYGQLYNADLQEALRRLDLMRESRDWQAARKMPKHLGIDKEGKRIINKARSQTFKAVIERFDFTASAIEKHGKDIKNSCFIGKHVTALEAQAIARRAFDAVQQYAFGKRGRPRFKPKGRLRSVEGKNQKAGIKLRDHGSKLVIEWDGLVLPLKLDPKDKDGWQAYMLSLPVKFCRIIRRTIRGQRRWFVQLVLKGKPFIKERHSEVWSQAPKQPVGIDIGPSTIAVVGEQGATLDKFAAGVEQPWAEIRVLQRRLDRSRRATNPDNYKPDGTVRKGPKRWNKSARYMIDYAWLVETERRLAARRRTEHGTHINQTLCLGQNIKTEGVSHLAFQKCFGRSVKVRAPGEYMKRLNRKAENAGGKVDVFSTRKTRLSQYCHVRDAYTKKPLSQRWHQFPNGTRCQRDLYSAFLARFVHGDKLDARGAATAFPAAEPLLRQAASGATTRIVQPNQSASASGSARCHVAGDVRADRLPKSEGCARQRHAADNRRRSKRDPGDRGHGGCSAAVQTSARTVERSQHITDRTLRL